MKDHCRCQEPGGVDSIGGIQFRLPRVPLHFIDILGILVNSQVAGIGNCLS